MSVVRTSIVITARDGYPLGARVYEPQGHAKSTLVVHGATATPQRYYQRFALHLADRGHRVLTYDYRGVGASRPPDLRGFDADMRDWAEDARTAHSNAIRISGSGPVLMLGHSFGGQLIGLCEELRGVSAAVLVGAQLGYYRHWPIGARLGLAGLWNVAVPALTSSYGYLPGKFGLGSDLPAGVALEWRRWCLHPSYLMGYVHDARARFARFDRPTVFYSFTDDGYAPEPAVDKMLVALSGARVTHRRMAPADLGARRVGLVGRHDPPEAEVQQHHRPVVTDEDVRRLHVALWGEVVEVADAVADGRSLPLTAVAPLDCALRASDIMADLEYGRT